MQSALSDVDFRIFHHVEQVAMLDDETLGGAGRSAADEDRVARKQKRQPEGWRFCFSYSWWPGAESNHRHKDFQSSALPTELPGQGAEL
jgi:hypothetical protein